MSGFPADPKPTVEELASVTRAIEDVASKAVDGWAATLDVVEHMHLHEVTMLRKTQLLLRLQAAGLLEVRKGAEFVDMRLSSDDNHENVVREGR